MKFASHVQVVGSRSPIFFIFLFMLMSRSESTRVSQHEKWWWRVYRAEW